MTAAEKLLSAGHNDVVIFDECSYDDALVGVTECGRAVYDYDKMVAGLMERDGCNPDQAAEWIAYNTIGELPNAGPAGPIIMYSL